MPENRRRRRTRDPRRQYDRGAWGEAGLPLSLGGEGGDDAERAAASENGESARDPESSGESEGAPMPLEALSTEQLTRELKRRQALLRQLVSRRNRLMRQLKELDARITELGGPQGAGPSGPAGARPEGAATPKRTRARNAISLPDAIAMAVEVRATITPTEAAQLVLRNGYRSTSKNFGMMVANALAKDARFHRVSRGVYERVS